MSGYTVSQFGSLGTSTTPSFGIQLTSGNDSPVILRFTAVSLDPVLVANRFVVQRASVGGTSTSQTPEKLTTRGATPVTTAMVSFTDATHPTLSGNPLIVISVLERAAGSTIITRSWSVTNPRNPIVVEPSSVFTVANPNDSGTSSVTQIFFAEPHIDRISAIRGRRNRRPGYWDLSSNCIENPAVTTAPRTPTSHISFWALQSQDWERPNLSSNMVFQNLLNGAGPNPRGLLINQALMRASLF